MRAFDLSPLLRSSVGFDRFNRLLDAASRFEDVGYPPYNIEKKGENDYRVTLAVAGFSEPELSITVQENTLVVAGRARSEDEAEGQEAKFLHRGIARRAFERRFELADTVQVVSAGLENGLLHIDLVRVVPEALKPRQIKILTQGQQPKAIDSKAA